jgi:soluble lytic murein transglycosylase-like protein
MECLSIIFICVGLTAIPAWADPFGAAREGRCIETSARYNHIPSALLAAIRLQEGGRVGTWHVNADGSVDYGVMQINSRWLPSIAAKGYTAGALTYDACASIAAGAWILAQSLAASSAWNSIDPDGRIYWRAVGDYHSRTPSLNRGYAEQVWRRYRQQVTAGGRP